LRISRITEGFIFAARAARVQWVMGVTFETGWIVW
jgi:hypothetical protein